MEIVPVTDEYILSENIHNLETTILRAALINFSIEHLLSKKLVTRNFKAGFDFPPDTYAGFKEAKRLLRFINKVVLARNPFLTETKILETSNGSQIYLYLGNFNYNDFVRDNPHVYRYLNKITGYMTELGLTRCSHTVSQGFLRSTTGGFYYPVCVVFSIARTSGNIVNLYKLIYHIDKVLKVISTLIRTATEYAISRENRNRTA